MPAAPQAETEEEAEERKQQHEQQRKDYGAEQLRRAEECRQREEREEQEREAEFASGTAYARSARHPATPHRMLYRRAPAEKTDRPFMATGFYVWLSVSANTTWSNVI